MAALPPNGQTPDFPRENYRCLDCWRSMKLQPGAVTVAPRIFGLLPARSLREGLTLIPAGPAETNQPSLTSDTGREPSASQFPSLRSAPHLVLGFPKLVSDARRRLEPANKLAAMARAMIDQTGERLALSDLHRLQAALTLAKGDRIGAESSLRMAIAIPREQGSKTWELRAAIDLARLWQSLAHCAVRYESTLAGANRSFVSNGRMTATGAIASELNAKS